MIVATEQFCGEPTRNGNRMATNCPDFAAPLLSSVAVSVLKLEVPFMELNMEVAVPCCGGESRTF